MAAYAEETDVETAVGPVVAVSIERKINLGNYESAGIFVSISNVTAETTEEEMEAAIETSHIAYDKLVVDLKAKVAAARGASK